jgi:hypothetical protein
MTLLKNYSKATAPCGLLTSRRMIMDWSRSRAYIAVSGLDALTVMEFSNPSNPTCYGSVASSSGVGTLDGIWSGELDTVEQIFYAPSLTDDAISVYNVTPATPTVLNGTASISAPPYSLDSVYDTDYIDISGSRLLVASSGTDSVISVFNVTNRRGVPVGLYTYTKATNPCGIVNPQRVDFIPGTNHLIVASTGLDTITILNISATGVLACVGTYTSSAAPYTVDGVQDFYYESDTQLLYVPAPMDNALTILSLANPALPVAVGEKYVAGSAFVSVAVNTVGDKKFAFLGSMAAGKGITVIDVTNPSGPAFNSTFYQTSGTCVYNTVYGIASSGNMLYATSGGDSCFYSIQLSSGSSSTNYSQSSQSCYNGTAWADVGTPSFATNNFSAANIYEQDLFFNTTSWANTSILNNTEYLVNTRNTTFANGQTWVLTCTAAAGANVTAANSTNLTLTG